MISIEESHSMKTQKKKKKIIKIQIIINLVLTKYQQVKRYKKLK